MGSVFDDDCSLDSVEAAEQAKLKFNHVPVSELFPHYFKDVKHLQTVDVYRVLQLFEVTDPAIQHAVKKLLCCGKRGVKERTQDIAEAIVALQRALDMHQEDASAYL